MNLWGGRFNHSPAQSMRDLSRSVHFDWRLAPYEIEVNLAHLHNLIKQKIISKSDGQTLEKGLLELAGEIGSGKFTYNNDDEDVHSAIERGLVEKCGQIGGAIRAGRSRNDLVITDFKLYLVDHLLEIASALTLLARNFSSQALNQIDVIAPGFTHTQHAQPITFGQELSKHSHALLRDVDRIFDWIDRNNYSPFGAGALAGSSIQPEPETSALKLGFIGVMENSIDAVSDRDFAAEALFIMAMIGIHLSKIGEEFVLWSSTEFDWVEIDDAYATGSSIMPQKKNADVAELARGKSGRFIGNLTALLVVLKAMPFAYNRDLQEDKEPLFDSFDTLFLTLPAVTGMISTTNFDRQKMAEAAPKGFSLATEIADYLVRKNIPFAIAHESAGQCVALCEKTSRELDQLTASELHSIHPQLDEGVMVVLSVDGALKSRTTSGGTAPSLVKSQIQAAQARNDLTRKEISRKVANFSEMMNQ